ncbi:MULTISPECIES: GNAT family N-acetyltransferase [Vagococcus]|uniref:Acetyltransferase n=1 Tax=Vagococcus fluvialis bH819 TaxID=1255619 RepID=A0A1X6WRF3_9ENTE|nr:MULTISPECIES: GNAT family N-acetyltransferase [Vagococcus]SLM86839.1 Acetyltransferase [Vagococcus fluvialis bH819]
MKRATKEQGNQIFELYKTLINSQANLEPYFFKEAEQTKKFIKEMIMDELSDFLIVEEGNHVLGFLAIREVTSPEYPMFRKRKSAYILDLVVLPSQRRMGYAKELLESAISWQEERKLEYLELCVLSSNKEAQKLYESIGFEPFSHQMILKN